MINVTAGDRIELLSMGTDPDPITPGTKGTVVFIDDGATVHVQWDNGRTLGLVPGEDHWRKIHDAEPSKEAGAPRHGKGKGAVHPRA